MLFNDLNLARFLKVAEAAKIKAAAKPAWVRAIEKAADLLASGVYAYEDDDAVVILSYSGETYRANGTCGCAAYAAKRPCWHRAAAKLVVRYREAEAARSNAVGLPEPGAPVPVVESAEAERARLIAEIKAEWAGKYSSAGIALGLTRRFGCNRLEGLSIFDLRQIRDVQKRKP
jgi:hypothetical protein